MENQQKKMQEQKVQEEKVKLDTLQMYAGLFSAGAFFSVGGQRIALFSVGGQRIAFQSLQYGLNRKKTGVCSFDTPETKKAFVLAFNGLICGPNTTKFISYCNEVGVSFTPMKNEIPHHDWIYGFMEDRIRVYRNEKTGRLSLHMYYSQEYVLQWYKKQFGGSVTQRKGTYRWKTCHKDDILKTLSFLLKEEVGYMIQRRHMEGKILSQMKEIKYNKQNEMKK